MTVDDAKTPFEKILTPNNALSRLDELETGKITPSAEVDFLEEISRDSAVTIGEEGIVITADENGRLFSFYTEAGVLIGTLFQDGAGNLQIDLADDTKAFTVNDGNLNINKATGNNNINLNLANVTQSRVWHDNTNNILNLENLIAAGDILFVLKGTTPASEFWTLYDRTAGVGRFRFSNAGYMDILETASEPAYEDGYAKLYYLDTGALKVRHKQGATETEITLGAGGVGDGWTADTSTWTAHSQAFTNNPAAGNNIVLNMIDTTWVSVGDVVNVSSSAGAENAIVTVIVANTSITVDCLTLDHTTTTPVVKLATTLPLSRAYTNNPAAGANISLSMADTSGFTVGDVVEVSSDAGRENAHITVVTANTSITVNTLALNHTTVSPMVRQMVQYSFIVDVDTDLTALIGVGDRLKLTNSTVKYFGVNAITATRLTLFGGTDYALDAGSAVTSPYYSHVKNPVGWNPDPLKWTIAFTDSPTRIKNSPAQNTVYWSDFSSIMVYMVPGAWRVRLAGMVWGVSQAAKTNAGGQMSLSLANNTIDTSFMIGAFMNGASGTLGQGSAGSPTKNFTVTTRTPLYLTFSTIYANIADLYLYNSLCQLRIDIEWAYL